MNWKSLGLVFAPAAHHEWMRSHASLPLAWPLGNGVFRVYFASRDSLNRSHIGSVELDLARPHESGALSADPVLAPGPLGHFDDHGVYPGSLVESGGRLFMYYIGWNPGARPPLFYSSIGLAVSDDRGATFHRYQPHPLIARGPFDPCLVTSPCVINDGGRWLMWYVSGIRWEESAQGLRSYYHIKYAESADGVNWERNGRVAIDLADGELNIARPCVIKDRDCWRMWFSVGRGTGYRLGYAESADGLEWTRMDARVRVESSGAWDSEAQAYPWVFEHAGQRYMLYNGNGFGRDGFGLAVESE